MSTDLSRNAPVAPGGTIGILGGGQLGRMLALAAARLGLKTHIFSDDAEAPAFQVCAARTHGDYRDASALVAFAATCDAITYEFENVPAETVAQLAPLKSCHPNARALAIAQDRFDEKCFVRSLSIGTANFIEVNSSDEAKVALMRTGAPAILKTRRLGYDGKGQAKVATEAELKAAFASFKSAPSILESLVDFRFEASVIAARAADGQFAAYDPPENRHEHHILRRSIVPSHLTETQMREAQDIARHIADALDYVGVFAVELFATGDGALLVNEIAPRVHNSGHYTLGACACSQFEQHMRAVAGLPLGPTEMKGPAIMINLLGELWEKGEPDWSVLDGIPGLTLRLYGKSSARPGRKMGHYVVVGAAAAEEWRRADERLAALARATARP
jgi:5-(carboxyamino)imidazole ribonucleotide synthase